MSVYFVDSLNGNDENSGLDALQAFKSLERVNQLKLHAGDRVLLKAGCVFSGHLDITDSGEQYAPIEIAFYGRENKKPVINGDESEYAVRVTGEYVTVRGLEVSNPKGKYGIALVSMLHGATRGVTVADCYVHDVWTDNPVEKNDINIFLGHTYRPSASWDHKAAGISVETNREAPTWYEGLRIEHNTVVNVNRTGIWLGGQWFNRFKNSFPWATNKADGMFDPWFPHKNAYIGHNIVDHAYGDGIIGIGCEGLIIEHNKVYYANCRSRVGACNAGLWSMCCDGALIQYNEVAYTGLEFGGDGEGFDIDNCSRNTIVQYNYSHDNAGGFMLICNITCPDANSHCNNIVRNNLSINDATKTDTAILNFTGAMKDVYILNNTVYTERENRFKLLQVSDYGTTGVVRDATVANNIFFSKNDDNWNFFEYNGEFTFSDNVWHNMPALPEKENITDRNLYNVNPVLQGEWKTAGTRLDVKRFIPCWNSPMLRLGKYYEQCAEYDYNGIRTTGHLYIGAFYYKDANIG